MTAAFAILLAACGDDAAAPRDAGPSTEDGAIAERDAGERPDARRLPDATRGRDDPDGNAAPADAVPLALGGAPMEGSTADDEDYDYFAIDAAEGQYVAVVLEVAGGDVFGGLLYVTLLSPDLERLVSGRDMNGCAGLPSATSELVTRIASTGIHIVELHPLYGSGSEWRIRAVDLATSPSTLVVAERGAPRVTSEHACVLGAFEEAGDADSVALDLALYTGIGAYTPGRHGSTGGASLLEIADDRATVRSRGESLVVVESAAPLTLRIAGPTTRGSNDHYLLRPGPLGFYGPPAFFAEAADAANDAIGGAEVIDPPPPDDGGYPPWFVFRIPPGDVDHFAFDASDSTTMMLSCQGASIGTGVRGLVLELLDGSGAVIATERENRLGMANLTASLEPGRHVVRFTAEGRDSSVASDLAACTASVGGT